MRETPKMTLVPNSQLGGASWPHAVHSFHPVSVGLQKCRGHQCRRGLSVPGITCNFMVSPRITDILLVPLQTYQGSMPSTLLLPGMVRLAQPSPGHGLAICLLG